MGEGEANPFEALIGQVFNIRQIFTKLSTLYKHERKCEKISCSIKTRKIWGPRK